jgi:hypothetical protein
MNSSEDADGGGGPNKRYLLLEWYVDVVIIFGPKVCIALYILCTYTLSADSPLPSPPPPSSSLYPANERVKIVHNLVRPKRRDCLSF